MKLQFVGHHEVLVEYQHSYLPAFAVWWSISRFSNQMGLEFVQEIPFQAVPNNNGTPRLYTTQPAVAARLEKENAASPELGAA